jgi:CheY-like chemotaxis protein
MSSFDSYRADTQNGRALIVDDDEAQALLSQLLLERLGYEVTICDTAAKALQYYQNGRDDFSFIASDYTMAPMDGLELARNILQLAPSAVFLLITGYDHPALLRAAREIGVREVCIKPTTVDEFAELLLHAGL